MEFFMDFFQALVGYMGVNLRGCNAWVAEHGLHASNICPALQKIRGKTVAQGVGGDLFYNSRQTAIFFYYPLNLSYC